MARFELAARGVQVFEQDAPRDAVDHQVMRDHEQALRRVGAELEQVRAQRRRRRQREALLHAGGGREHRGLPRGGCRVRQRRDAERNGQRRRRMRLLPRAGDALETQPQRVVMRRDAASARSIVSGRSDAGTSIIVDWL